MQTDKSVKDLCQFLWSLENRHKLFEWKESGIYVWPLLRFKIYYLLSEKIDLFEKAHPFESSAKDKVGLLIKSLYLLLFKNPLKFVKDKDYFLVRHPRKVEGIDLYSAQLSEELGKDAFISDTIDEAFKKKYVISLEAYKAWTYLLFYALKPFIYFHKKHPNLAIVEREIEKKYGLNLDLQGLYQNQFFKFKMLKKMYRTIFAAVRPKKLILVGAYFRQEMVAAAQLENIPVIELQHGVITKYHLGYSYPNYEKIPYFPDEIWGFGQYWFDSTPLPAVTKTQVIGAPYIFELANKNKEHKNIAKTILFTSQGVIGLNLFEFAYEVASKLSDYKITFRLHPSETLSKYESIYKRKPSLANFVISAKEVNIFALIAQNEFQVGVFSTTLFEGLVLGAKAILINMPGIEYMDSLIESKEVICVNSVEEFITKFNSVTPVSSTESYYAKPIKTFKSIL